MISHENFMVKKLVEDLSRQQEEYIKEALTELVSRGILVVERSNPTIVEDLSAGPASYRITQSIRLVPKEKEYIEKLEKENKEMKTALAKVKEGYGSFYE